MDFYEDGLYLLMLVAATVLVAVVITLMTKSMLKKKSKSTGQLTISADAGAPKASDAESSQKPADKPEERRQEQLQEVVTAKQLQEAIERPDAINAVLDAKEAEAEVEAEAETETGDVLESSQVASTELEKDNSIFQGTDEDADLMNLFQAVEDDNSELTALASNLPDVDLDSLKALSEEVSLALLKRTARKKEG